MNKERIFYIDWLRILLIFSVFLYHIGMFFNTWGWHIKNNETTDTVNNFMIFLHYWRMPLLFMISGGGTFFALQHRSAWKYLGERSRRLLLPVIFGIFVIVPPQVYVEKQVEYSGFLDFYRHFTEGTYPEGNFSWHHLWFVVYLFVFSILALPVFMYLKTEKAQRFFRFIESWAVKPGALYTFVLILITSQVLLRPYFPDETHALFDDWAYFTYGFLYFVFGFMLLSRKKLQESIEKHRYLNLGIMLISAGCMFSTPYLNLKSGITPYFWGVTSIFVGWSASLAAIGFSKRYLNKDLSFRKILNEAIYPFYILHQTVIIIIASTIRDTPVSILYKSIVLTLSSLIAIIVIYWFLVRPWNLTRLVFGMKWVKK